DARLPPPSLLFPYTTLFRSTDSAASSTAMATGVKTMNGVIVLDKQLSRVDSALEIAKLNNKKTGIVVTAEISHATPAGFAAHVRSEEHTSELQSRFDLVCRL